MNEERKTVLMLCPEFFGYEKRISKAFCDGGFEVKLYDERPNKGFFCKACMRFGFKFYKPIVRKYIKKIIDENRNKKFDYIFVVKGEAVGEKEAQMLRSAFPTAKMILYFWDSVDNTADGEKKITFYDRVLTFDQNDAEKYNLTFLPLPFGEEYVSSDEQPQSEYDVAFIGTSHSVRPRIVKQIKEQCDRTGRKCFIYFYSPHILVYLLNKLTNRNFKYVSMSEINFKPLCTEEVCRIYNSSKCILDIEHPRQHGTTTRPVEMLPMKKKIITTNRYVKDFDFYSENNFCIIDRDNPVIDEEFFDKPYIDVAKDVIDKYSPQTFAKKCFDELEC